MRVFKVLDDKSIVKAENRILGPLFLLRFPYRNRDENSLFSYFSKEKYGKG